MAAKILIADDDPKHLRMLEYALHHEGYDVIMARNGVECLKKVESEDPDLVIVDVMMPDMGGLEVCQQVRDMPVKSTLPIIMVSALGQTPDKVAGFSAGADDYITKPIVTEELVVRIEALRARTQRLREEQQVGPGRILGFIGAKGGVGTTTAALNIATLLARQNKSVIALELRIDHGTFSSQLNQIPAGSLRSLLRVAAEDIDKQELLRHLSSTRFGVEILFGPQRVEEYQVIKPDQAEAILNGLAQIADYTIVDLPSYPSAANRAALRCCDLVVLVVEHEPISIASGKVLLKLLSSWGVGIGVIRVLVVNRSASASGMSLADIQAELNCEVVGLIPPMAEACLKAQQQAVPVVISHPNLIAVSSLAEITKRLGAE